MNSLISKFALEGKTDGAGNGKFYLDKSGAAAVASEVVQTHFGFTGEKKESFLAGKFDKLWNHYDVLGQGWLAVEKGPQFLRQILGENEVANGLQLQTEERRRKGFQKYCRCFACLATAHAPSTERPVLNSRCV